MEYSFALRSSGMSADDASNLVGWLVEQFALGRCGFLAGAAARELGRDHYVALVHPDGRLAHAVLAVSPQFDRALRGDGADIFGRRNLREIFDEVKVSIWSERDRCW